MKSKPIDNTNETTLKLTVSAIMIALATVLSLLKPFELPFGGSVTLFSFVPILFVGYAYGIRWGLCTGVVHGVLQMILEISSSISGCGFKWWQVLICALLDYIIAFAALGLAGIFKNKISNKQLSFALGTLLACIVKYITHVISGYVLFGGYASDFFKEQSYGEYFLNLYSGKILSLIYSIVYNALFSVPETIISIIMVVIIISVKPIRKAAKIK